MCSAADIGPLAEFLRSHRERLAPDLVGIRTRGIRRVPGLRREEVATRAGISIEYYIRLEQGRERNPSRIVCDALATALTLDRYETGHLHELAGPRKPIVDHRSPSPEISEGSRVLVETLGMPAIIQTRYTDVLVSNPMAEALSPALHRGVNRIRSLFIDPSERAMHLDWNRATANCVAQLRFAVGGDLTVSPARELIDDLLQHSDTFRGLWSRHEVNHAPISPIRLLHPTLGRLKLFREKLLLVGTDDLAMVVFHAEPFSRSWSALQRLTDLSTATRHE
ncbi:MAG: helix-turn-helix transcriptional regulator [Mycobacterium sp.]